MRYINANEYLADTWKLAAAIRRGGWRPDLLIALWRGGAGVGIAVHEFLKASGWPVDHLPLKCASYARIGERGECVRFFHGDGIFADIHAGQRVLVVDDVFDSGKTAEAVSERIASTGAQMRFACVYWKRAANTTALAPDYFVSDPGEEWIVFPHEIEGLDSRQLAEKDPELARLLAEASL